MLQPRRLFCALLLVSAATQASAADPFQQQVLPFLQTYCVQCHNAERTEAELNLTRYTSSASLGEDFRQWEHVLDFVGKGDMPPAKAKQPTPAERAALLETIKQLMAAEARKLTGDPGVVLPRRLTGAEYNYTIRDLTGVDIRPAESFPVDPASGEGFNNTGEALVMSPNLFKKYYAAAQFVSEHVVLTPSGLRFAPYPVVTFADQMKYHEQAIIRFYEQQNASNSYEEYLTVAWGYRHLPASQKDVTLEQIAIAQKLSPKYLAKVWDFLTAAHPDDKFPAGWIRRQWAALPAPMEGDNPVALPSAIAALANTIRRTSKLLCAKETDAIVGNAGNAPVSHIDRRRKSAAERSTFDPKFIVDNRRLHIELRNLQAQPTVTIHLRASTVLESPAPAFVLLKELNFSSQSPNDYRPNDKDKVQPLRDVLMQHAPGEWQKLKPGMHPLGHAVDADTIVLSTSAPLEITVPTKAFGDKKEIRFFAQAQLDREHTPQKLASVALSDRPIVFAEGDELNGLLLAPDSPHAAALTSSSQAFCSVFPNRFVYVDDTRGLSAGFHLIEGVFRDDVPLCNLVLSDEQKRELDRLWDELYFGTGMSEKLLRGFVFFERSERNFLKDVAFDSFKEEDPELVKDETLARFESVYLAKSGVKPDDPKLAEHPIHFFFQEIRDGLKRRREQLTAAQPVYQQQLLDFAERAYRRSLTADERARIVQFFEKTAAQPEFGVDQAVRGVVTSILVSPHFCFRIDVPPEGESVKPLTDVALASRLSYFLWSSTPDAELLALANAGKLNNEAELRRQTRRMLQDPKVSGFALEFFGQWLRYRDFLTQESVDRRVFPAFNDDLKQAMFEEPTRLATHLIQHNLPVTDLLYGDTTFVNKPLADHYGWTYRAVDGGWQQVDNIQQQGRGGILGMAVFLTDNSQPQRTSPVKRGFWVVHKILGEHIPAPPNEVPPLPAKETETDGKTIRQLLAQHVEAETCARCHRRFDPIGLSMEGFDPIGKSRTQDLAGRPVDNVVKLPSGEEAKGVPQFLKFLQASRNDDFIRTLSHKFLGYALGRSLELSDQALLETMQTALRQDGYRFATLFETVVCSPQFRNQRCRDFSIARFRSESPGE